MTLGLPFVRTSPDHGTALDIAGQGRARPDSLIAAIELAAAMARRRREHGRMTTPAPLRLGLNLDHVATLRNARGGAHPDPVRFAHLAIEAGADSITVHLREDRRHIRDADVERLMAELSHPLNLEMAVTAGDGGDRPPPAAARHLPRPREAAPRSPPRAGWMRWAAAAALAEAVAALGEAGCRVSLFVDPEPAQLDAAVASRRARGRAAYRQPTARRAGQRQAGELDRLRRAARHAAEIGLECHAGHGLTYANVRPVAAIAHDRRAQYRPFHRRRGGSRSACRRPCGGCVS